MNIQLLPPCISKNRISLRLHNVIGLKSTKRPKRGLKYGMTKSKRNLKLDLKIVSFLKNKLQGAMH